MLILCRHNQKNRKLLKLCYHLLSLVPDWTEDEALELLDQMKAHWADISQKGHGLIPNTVIFQEIGEELMQENVPEKMRGKDALTKWNNLKAEHKKWVVHQQKSGQGVVKPSVFDEPIDAILGKVQFQLA